MSQISRLPQELLLEVFRIHVFVNLDSPQRLIRVCQRWHKLATSTGSLWGKIIFSSTPHLSEPTIFENYNRSPMDPLKLENGILVTSFNRLTRALDRTGNSHFEMNLDGPESVILLEKHQKSLDPYKFNERCRALRFIATKNISLSIKELIFPNLQVLEIHDTFETLETEEDIFTVLVHIQQNSPHFRHLRLPQLSSSFKWQQFPPLFGRLTQLRVHLDTTSIQLVKQANRLSILQLESQGSPWNSQDADPIVECDSPSLDRLHLQEVKWTVISPNIVSNLRHLSMSCHYIDYQGQTLELPRLITLSVRGWWPVIMGLQAPLLETLQLRTHVHFFKIRYRWGFDNVSLQPTRLDVDVGMPEHELDHLVFAHWRKVTDLQLVYIGEEKSLWNRLSSSLHGKPPKDYLCPNLQKLVILSTKRTPERQAMSEGLLRGVAKELSENGQLTEAKYGWCEPRHQMEDPRESRISWVDVMPQTKVES